MVANNSVIVGLLQKTYLTSALFQKISPNHRNYQNMLIGS